MTVSKVLVLGPVRGQLAKAFQKISKLHLKQTFSFAIVTGDLFATESSDDTDDQMRALIDGSIKVMLPTYFTLGDHSLPIVIRERLEAHGEVCPNLFYLGRKGTLKTTEGVRIVNLGGKLVQSEESLTQAIGNYDPLYTDADAKVLYGAHSADILITNQWPTDITKNSQISVSDTIGLTTANQTIANLCLALRPRYHFSNSPMAAWSREPFMVPAAVQGRQLKSYEELDGPVRFTSLASIEKSNKECLSAFNLDPSTPPSQEGAQQSCPLSLPSSMKRKRDDGDEGNFRYARDPHPDRRSRRNNRKNRDFDPSNCFMCTSNDSFDSSMIVSIADDSILTVLKGPLSLRGETFPHLKCSGHIMIIPMYHAADEASHGKRSAQDMEREFNEMTKYRQSIQQMLAHQQLGAVCWEVNRTGIRHFHWQLIACPLDKIKSGMVKAAYKVAAESYKTRSREDDGKEREDAVKFQSCEPNTLIPGQRSDFFRVWIWQPEVSASKVADKKDDTTTQPVGSAAGTNLDQKHKSPVEIADEIANGHGGGGDAKTESETEVIIPGKEESMFFAIPSSMSFNISFGREVMAGILQLEQRSDWRKLESGNGLEAADAQAWQEEYQKGGWDFAMA